MESIKALMKQNQEHSPLPTQPVFLIRAKHPTVLVDNTQPGKYDEKIKQIKQLTFATSASSQLQPNKNKTSQPNDVFNQDNHTKEETSVITVDESEKIKDNKTDTAHSKEKESHDTRQSKTPKKQKQKIVAEEEDGLDLVPEKTNTTLSKQEPSTRSRSRRSSCATKMSKNSTRKNKHVILNQ